MPRYRVLVKSFINNTIIDPETMSPSECIVEYDGKPGSNLELVSGKPAATPEVEQTEGEAPAKPQKGFARKVKADAV